MKGQAVSLGEQHQRKEAQRKEKVTMPKEIPEEHDWEPETCRAAIYLRGPEPSDANQTRDVPPIFLQRMHCRCLAAMMCAEVVGEFVDESMTAPWRSRLNDVLELAANGRPVDYLIVYSKGLLASDCNEVCDVAWRLGNSGAAVMAADEHRVPLWFEM
jgi:hypothetical protein